MGEVVVAPPPLSTRPQLGLEREVFQHGSIGDFLTSSIEGVQSGFIRCVYKAKNAPNNTVTLLCEKVGGCCMDGCCPKDQFWMMPLIVLLVFCLVIFVAGCISMIFCYQRSKNKQRKEEKMAYEYGTEVCANHLTYFVTNNTWGHR